MTAKVFNLRKARKNTLTIARELCYNEITLGKILCAKTQGDLDRTLQYGRQTKGRIINDCVSGV